MCTVALDEQKKSVTVVEKLTSVGSYNIVRTMFEQ